MDLNQGKLQPKETSALGQTAHSNGITVTFQNTVVPTLQHVLKNPIQFVPATELTLADERRMSSKVWLVNGQVQTAQAQELNKEIQQQNTNFNHQSHTQKLNKQPAPSQTSKVSSDWDTKSFRVATSTGFQNRGMLCYRNSVIQALLHTPKLVNWLVHFHNRCDIRFCVACKLKELSLNYWNERTDQGGIHRQLLALQNCLKATNAFRSPGFHWSRQHDAPEFYQNVINAMMEKTPSLSKIVKSLLGHSLAIKMVCRRCGDETKLDTRQNEDLILSIKYSKASSLEKLLRHVTFGRSTVQGRRCEKCKNASDTPRTERILTAPEVLVIQLHRFSEVSSIFGGFKKDQEPVPFPELLDLTEFTETATDLKYSLLSVIQHLGSRESGHYKIIAKGPSEKWEEIEDEMVRRVRVDAALNPRSPWTPYMLFYAKVEDVNQTTQSASLPRLSTPGKEVPYLNGNHKEQTTVLNRKRQPSGEEQNERKKFRM